MQITGFEIIGHEQIARGPQFELDLFLGDQKSATAGGDGGGVAGQRDSVHQNGRCGIAHVVGHNALVSGREVGELTLKDDVGGVDIAVVECDFLGGRWI